MPQTTTTEYTDFHRKAINVLSWLSVSVTEVVVDENGIYKVKDGHWIGKFLYVFVTLNTTTKLVYLLLLVNGYYGPVEFLDKMSALLWILMCGEIYQELNLWTRQYPLFEILAQLWKCENEIFCKLGKPEVLKRKLKTVNWHTVLIHMAICFVGDSFMVIQFLAAPKYSCYTYAAFKEEDEALLIIFAIHEFLFIWQAWNGYVSVVCISSINAAELTYTIQAMTETLNSLKDINPTGQDVISTTRNGKQKNEESVAILNLGPAVITLKELTTPTKKNILDPKHIATGTQYDITSLLSDYKKLMLIVDQLNGWFAYKIVGVHATGYGQFISDVFMTIQLLKLPDFDIVSVLWFLEDSLACLFMLFRMFALMSRVQPASQSFVNAFQHYLELENPIRQQLRKVLNTLQLVSVKLGPCPVTPHTVGAAMMMIMNYYVCVALWPDS